MSVVLESEPLVVANPVRPSLDRDLVKQLKEETAILQYSESRFGTYAALNQEQVTKAAKQFNASPSYVRGKKKLVDSKDPVYAAVTNVLSRAKRYWMAVTVPFPERGRRLIRRARIEQFKEQMESLRAELEAAKTELAQHCEALIAASKQELQDLFNENDYPRDIAASFDFEWGLCSGDPPEYLKQLNPELYAQQQQRIAAKFQESLELTEQAMASELGNLLQELADKLTGISDGKQKQLGDRAIGPMLSFFERFKEFNIGSNAELDKVVEQAKQMISGVVPNDLRRDVTKRQVLKSGLEEIKGKLTGLLVDRPRRSFDRESLE
jgi:hypothetical protein